jgi:hypothetical protein
MMSVCLWCPWVYDRRSQNPWRKRNSAMSTMFLTTVVGNCHFHDVSDDCDVRDVWKVYDNLHVCDLVMSTYKFWCSSISSKIFLKNPLGLQEKAESPFIQAKVVIVHNYSTLRDKKSKQQKTYFLINPRSLWWNFQRKQKIANMQ